MKGVELLRIDFQFINRLFHQRVLNLSVPGKLMKGRHDNETGIHLEEISYYPTPR